MKFILGTKLDMTQTYASTGEVVPVTSVKVGPCAVTQVKTLQKDGYAAVQIGFGEKRNASRAHRGHVKQAFAGKEGRGFKFLKEGRMEVGDEVKKGDSIDITSFAVGEKVNVVGDSKGRGFAGVVKRHHFHGHPPTHGHKDQERMPGSIGAGGNQHVFKGVRMAGRMGNARITVKNLEIISIDAEEGIMRLKGAVPGARNGLVILTSDNGTLTFKRQVKNSPVPDAEEKTIAAEPQEHAEPSASVPEENVIQEVPKQ